MAFPWASMKTPPPNSFFVFISFLDLSFEFFLGGVQHNAHPTASSKLTRGSKE